MVIRVSWGMWNPIFGGRGGRRGQRWHHSTVSYAFHCDRCAICNHSAAICDRMSPSPTLKSTGGGSLWTKIPGCYPWSRPLMCGSSESEHPKLTNGEIISDEFQPMWSQSTNVTDGRTDRQTDDMHRAVITNLNIIIISLYFVHSY